MKILSLYILCCTILSGCIITDHEKREYMNRHSKNYDKEYIISRNFNPDMPGTAAVYDAEDFRAGALAACNEIQKYYGEDLCTRAGYWGVVGPRVTPEQSDYKLNAIGL